MIENNPQNNLIFSAIAGKTAKDARKILTKEAQLRIRAVASMGRFISQKEKRNTISEFVASFMKEAEKRGLFGSVPQRSTIIDYIITLVRQIIDGIEVIVLEFSTGRRISTGLMLLGIAIEGRPIPAALLYIRKAEDAIPYNVVKGLEIKQSRDRDKIFIRKTLLINLFYIISMKLAITKWHNTALGTSCHKEITKLPQEIAPAGLLIAVLNKELINSKKKKGTEKAKEGL